MSKLGDRRGSKLGPDARSILEAGRDGDNPTSADRARVKKALMRSIAAGTALGATSAASSASATAGGAAVVGAAKATSIGLGIKLLGVAVLALIVSGGVLLERAGEPDPAPAPPPADTVSAKADAVNEAPAMEPATTAPAKVAVPDPIAPSRPSEAAAAEKPTALVPQPSARAVAREPVDRPEEASVPIAVAAPAPIVAAPPATEEDPLAAETRRLREAHGALQAGDPQKALGLLGEQGGQLGEERAAARVIALCQLGRSAEAEAARAAFLREHPRSPLADRVRGGCAASIAK